ncbi:hypothetical protein HAX54_017150 [Datura stramonium]|uniref:Uncharacterized protein n=1 Tax=Datura stramonium TaxID=4076 RepID=A0ABS8UMF7_DATST|nr:hypothetical protein [Datura stramonium]
MSVAAYLKYPSNTESTKKRLFFVWTYGEPLLLQKKRNIRKIYASWCLCAKRDRSRSFVTASSCCTLVLEMGNLKNDKGVNVRMGTHHQESMEAAPLAVIWTLWSLGTQGSLRG